MTCIRLPGQDGAANGFLCVGDPFRLIYVAGKWYQFEMHSYCGPVPINRDFSTRLTDWPRVVWDAVMLWIDQGRRVDENEGCIWEGEA